MSILGDLTNFMASGVGALGYPGIFLFMFIEGAITPIPSVVIVPFAGALAARGAMSLPVAVAVASLGTMGGSGGGNAGVFLANCFAGSRSVVAYPAGAGRMSFVPFLLATFGGSLIWNSVLAVAGFLLFQEWERIVATFELIDLVAFLAVLGGIGAWVWYKRRVAAKPATETP